MEMTIKTVRPEDAHSYTLCHIACWRAAYRGIIPDSYLDAMSDDLDRKFRRTLINLSTPDTLFYYADIGGKMAGRLIIGRSRDGDTVNFGEIGAFYLLKEFWGRGFGRQMMDFALDKLRSLGYREISLWVLEENSRARRFYEKSGFAPDGGNKIITLAKPLVELRYIKTL